MKYSLLIACCLAFSLLQGQNIINEIPPAAFDNYANAYNYTFWDDSFKTSITGPRKFSIQTSSFQLRVDYDNLNIDHLSINEEEQQANLAFAASKAMIFEQQQGGAIDFAVLQNGAVLHKKSTNATNFGNSDSQMAEYGTWLNRRFVSVNFDNNPSFETYFTGVEFTNWHNRLKMTLHVRPTVDISNGQLSFSVEIPSAYSQHISNGTIHAFSNNSNAGFALKAGTTAETITQVGNTLTLTTASQTLSANTSYEVSLLFYATKEQLSDTYTTLPAEESEISIQTSQTLPNANQNATASYIADEGIHYIDVPRYGMGYNNCGQEEQLQNIEVALQNTSAIDKRVRLCFRQIPNVNVVGFNSLLRNNNGDPSGFPLQISKNWHNGTTQLFSGSWIREYTEILVPANSVLNFDYTRTGAKWGETYGASSHQLSVVGSGVPKGGWLEAALGSFGENITHSPDYQFGNSNICDYRPFLVTNEAYQGTSQECFWTGNVGGMDMWVYVDDNNQRIHQSQVKTKFQRYSPNLTETSISAYSSNNKLKLDYTFYLNRSDDYVRVYYKIKIKALEDTPFNRFDIFQMGGDSYNVYKAQSVYYGNVEGIEGQYAPTNDGSNNYTNSATALTGIQPWIWAGNGKFTNGYGGINLDTNNGLIIRDYKAHLGGTTNNTPYFRERSSSRGFAANSGENPTSYCLVSPPDITSFSAGDSIELILETVILPKQDGDYYGPNTNFSNALSTHGNSVDLFLRECQGNKIELTSPTNTVNEIYPYSVHTIDNTATFTMSGGKGYVPIVFKGLDNVTDPSLWRSTNNCWEIVDQSTWGKDFWQADFQAETGLFDLVYNVNQDINNDAKAKITYYLGTTPPTPTIVVQTQRNEESITNNNLLKVALGDAMNFAPQVQEFDITSNGDGIWSWSGPNSFTANTRILEMTSVAESDLGSYTVFYTNTFGCSTNKEFMLSCLDLDENSICDVAEVCSPLPVFLNDPHTESVDIKTEGYIEASATIETGKIVSYLAEQYILLKEGFEVVAGASFNAVIQACSSNRISLKENKRDKKQLTTNTIQVSPNPFKDFVYINYSLSKATALEISIEDLSGRKIVSLLQTAHQPAGRYNLKWQRIPNLTSGILLLTLKTEDGLITKKLVLSL